MEMEVGKIYKLKDIKPGSIIRIISCDNPYYIGNTFLTANNGLDKKSSIFIILNKHKNGTNTFNAVNVAGGYATEYEPTISFGSPSSSTECIYLGCLEPIS